MRDDFSTGRTILSFLDIVAWVLITVGAIVIVFVYSNSGQVVLALATGASFLIGGVGIMLGAILGRAQIATAENTANLLALVERALKAQQPTASKVTGRLGEVIKTYKSHVIRRTQEGVEVEGRPFRNVLEAEGFIDALGKRS